VKKITFGLVVFGCIIIFNGCGSKDDSNAKISENSQSGTLIYLVESKETDFDGVDSLNVDCDDKIVGVDTNEELSPKGALEKLLSFQGQKKGLKNVLKTSDNLKIEKLVIQNNFAILTLSKDLNAGGMCDESQIRAQITQTLTQFDEIDGVDIFVGDEELSSYLMKKSDKVIE